MTFLERLTGLRHGLSLEQVRQHLTGWKEHHVLATNSMDGQSHSDVWDFTLSSAETVRITFVDDELIAWGMPADTGR